MNNKVYVSSTDGMTDTEENQRTQRKTYLGATLSTVNPTWTGRESNPDLRGQDVTQLKSLSSGTWCYSGSNLWTFQTTRYLYCQGKSIFSDYRTMLCMWLPVLKMSVTYASTISQFRPSEDWHSSECHTKSKFPHYTKYAMFPLPKPIY
jgi:hypothetical protein